MAMWTRALRAFWRAARLRCPECGVSAVFLPLRRTRSWRDWSTPLAGCPRCGYAYEREPGYFLPAIWVVHVFTVFGLGMALGLLLDALVHPPLGTLVLAACVPTVVFAVLFVRHAKVIYLAFDHLISPQSKAGRPEADS
jgi:uncharacterized protein (DUF983 family)